MICDNSISKEVIGIPMGTDCELFFANLFLFAYEYKWLKKRFNAKKFLLCIKNNQFMDEVMTEIYPEELKLTNDNAVLESHYLDFGFRNSIWPLLFDERDAF